MILLFLAAGVPLAAVWLLCRWEARRHEREVGKLP